MYQVIARKYRPQTFQEVVNQDHVKRTLTNALSQGRVGHGYIFSGQRGTGKTTMARLLAKALNCDQGPTAEPCLECPSCKEIAAGNSMDVIEIDAASNRRIDDIRELRENVRYRPVRDRHKVFIIDEAHQITTDAFNALLKTLEEPPEWVVFILCTTEPHEFPPTIVSRCQSFPFRAVELEQVVERMKWICSQEGIEADDDALVSIALAGDGSIRDSLSTLDQAIACFGKKLDAAAVRDLLGAIPSEITDQIVQALRDHKPAAMLELVQRLMAEGRNAQHFCGELTRYFRNLLVMKIAGPETRLVTAGPREREALCSHAEHFSQEDLTRYQHLLLDLYRDLQHASQPRFRLEAGLLKLVYAGYLQPIEQALLEWGSAAGGDGSLPGETKTASGAVRAQAEREPPAKKAAVQRSSTSGRVERSLRAEDKPKAAAVAPSSERPAAELPAAPSGGDEGLKRELIRLLHEEGDEHLADAIEHGLLISSGNAIVIRSLADYRTCLEIEAGAVRQHLRRILGKEVALSLGSDLSEADLRPSSAGGSSAPGPAVTAAAGEHSGGNGAADVAGRALADPEVQKFQKLFQGRVREVRNLKGYSS